MRTFKDCTHYFFYSEKQKEKIYLPPWSSRAHEDVSPLPTFKGKSYTEMRGIGTGWPNDDDVVYLGAGTYADVGHNLSYKPGNRSQDDSYRAMWECARLKLNKLVGGGIASPRVNQFDAAIISLNRDSQQARFMMNMGFDTQFLFKSDKQIASERMEELVKLVNYDRAKKLTDQLASALKVCYDALCTYASHPIIGAYVNKLLKEYNDDKSV